MKRILVRCDANEANGYGHFSRCLNIARGIKEKNQAVEIYFCGNYAAQAQKLINQYGINCITFTDHNPDSAQNLLARLKGVDYLVLDSYLITQNYIDDLCGGKYRFVVIDDYNKFDLTNAELVVNFSINALDFDYKSKEQALGTAYFPAKPELKKVREEKLKAYSGKIDNILIMFGGYDRFHTGLKISSVLDDIVRDCTISLILPGEELKLKNNKLKILPFQHNVEKLYSQADIMITGGGLSKYESAYCCIPNANSAQTEDERFDSDFFMAKGLAHTLCNAYSYNHDKFVRGLKRFLEPAYRKMLYTNCASMFETDSLNNLVGKILNN